jgi:lysyl-tRNA synthetase class 2
MSIALSEQEIIRRESLQQLRALGINPYPAEAFDVNAWAQDITDNFKDKPEAYQNVVIAGRIMTRRIMGSASFAEIQDSTGRVQIYLKRDDICPDEDKTLYNTVFKKLLDIGDYVGIKGYVFLTQTGEISVHVRELIVLSKSLNHCRL